MAATRRAKANVATKFDEILASAAGPEPIVLDGGNIVAEAPTVDQLETLQSVESDDAARDIMFGEDAEKATAYFKKQPPHVWVAFLKMYFEHWLNFEDLGK